MSAAGQAEGDLSGESLPAIRSRRGLDGLDFLMADVRHGVGPCLSIHLIGARDWRAGPASFVGVISVVAA